MAQTIRCFESDRYLQADLEKKKFYFNSAWHYIQLSNMNGVDRYGRCFT